MSDHPPSPHRRRPRYSGKNPRRFEEKYKELAPERYPDTIAKVIASGKTPAGSHIPIMVDEVLEALEPTPGEVVVDGTLGHGGHARALLRRIQPGGLLIGLDVDPLELPRTEARLRAQGFGTDTLRVRRSNFAGLQKALTAEGLNGADAILVDLGVSSMQLDVPSRGFSLKLPGPLDMRMNPQRGLPASALLERSTPGDLAIILTEGADEPHAEHLANVLAGRSFGVTTDLAAAIRDALPRLSDDARELSVRRVFQALRVAVNEEFTALDTLLRQLPSCLRPGGRVAFLTFHSGEDRRVKKAFAQGVADGSYAEASTEVVRPGAAERRANPRSSAAKLRWARRP